MTAQNKSTIKGYFETGDKPTQAQFTDLVDSYQDADETLDAVVSAVQGGGTGIINVTASGAVTMVAPGAVGLNVLQVVTTASAQSQLGVVIGTDVQAYDANTSKLDVAETRSASLNLADNELIRPKIKDYGETVNAIGSIGGGTQDIDLTLGNVVTGTVDTSTTTFTFSNPSASGTACSFTFIITNGGSQTVNWPASVDWPSGSAPSLTSSGVDVVSFLTVDGGTTWLGFEGGLDFS